MKQYTTALLLVGLLARPAAAVAQTAPWVPITLAALGQTADTLSTHHFLATSRCVEGNRRYTQPPFSPQAPDTAKMWRDKALLVGGMAALNVVIARIAGRSTTKKSKAGRWLAQGTAYAAFGVGVAQAVDNLRCQ